MRVCHTLARSTAAIVVLAAAVVLVLGPSAAGAAVEGGSSAPLTPIVLFPAFHFTKLEVTVRNQTTDPSCPRSGTFEDWFLNDQPSTTFSQVCRDELLTLRYDDNPAKPMPKRFSDQRGVTVDVLGHGTTESAPFYEPMYEALEAAGYVRDVNIRVAGYDARLTPDQGGFLQRTKKLIEDTYRENGNRPVHLVGHSNGPLYAQYLLTHTTQAWKDKYIHGFTPIAGNFPGQGALYPILFTGLNIEDFSFPATKEHAVSSARMYLSTPSSYMSAADPRVFGDRETVVEDASTGRSYTPQDYGRLFTDAGLRQAKAIADYYIGFVRFTDPTDFPNVDVYAEKGSGIETVVGARLNDLSVGQLVDASTQFFTRDGDINQEDITNEAVLAWQAMPCFHFSLTDNPGVDHFSLPSDPNVLARLIADVARPRTLCSN
jgi:lecithin-cholesterol acyltransferase